ncbi:formylglycine-generating enzyme family protein [Anabaena sp. UHCC 0451]|uniref:formylglycine-generating enzyme family protein n=1 Tax=Anabaena sp. UHCC 0451 TaxID=2055235 RepID=UPI002B20D954|nr:formylglycine-generating enzyme family protein [Anabaena sp. UHCC 0451]MEA5578658.1 formylglycine-generating enzyme family protein [Anabaena sp. UHCC 0451]
MTQITDEIIAQNKVERFVSRFESSYRLLAYHAALPLVLTPELVNYLRVQFLKSEGVPWIAEADLLLSDLCRPVGYELYVMDESVRVYLLQQLEQDERFGEKRIKEIARLLLNYVKHLAKTNPFLGNKDIQTQKWGAMLYLDTEQTVREIAKSINESIINKAEISRLYKIAEDFKQQINKSQTAKPEQFQDLLKYAQVVNDLLRKPETVKQEEITSSYQIAGDNLTIPKSLVNSSIKTFKVATIEIKETYTFDFQVATIELKKPRLNIGKPQLNIKRQPQQADYFLEKLGDNLTLEMVTIPGGTFMMGSPSKELERQSDESPQHSVTVQPFLMGKYPVTQAQWRFVAQLPQVNRELEQDPSNFKGANRPVERVSWYDAVEFCDRLSEYTGKNYRLPSEAEWEYACRAGTTTPFHFGETITTDLANYDGNYTYGDGVKGVYREETTEVGSFGVANNFGLYDMHGNVWEWCLDDWHDNYKDAPIDESAWFNSGEKLSDKPGRAVLRGGSWNDIPYYCRSASRNYNLRDVRDLIFNGLGFRVVCVVGRILQ